MPLAPDLAAEARRQLTACNACRYCEGYCATFLALERRPALTDGDISLIANICHDCRGCYQACMYTPPHEFAIEIPELLAGVRAETYRAYAWPRRLRALFRRSAAAPLGGAVAGLVFVVIVALVAGDGSRLLRADSGPGSFYRVVPFPVMLAAAGVLALAALALWSASAIRFSRDVGVRGIATPRELWGVVKDSLAVRWLKGAGEGCYYPDSDRPDDRRRLLHVLVVVGFVLANVSTAVAAAYQHLLLLEPPFPLLSPPVLAGIAGGVAMIAGTTGLLVLKARSSGAAPVEMARMDAAFLVVFDLVAITGMLTLALRDTPLMSAMLFLHLASLAGLFVTAVYGKFVHALYRLVAVLEARRFD